MKNVKAVGPSVLVSEIVNPACQAGVDMMRADETDDCRGSCSSRVGA